MRNAAEIYEELVRSTDRVAHVAGLPAEELLCLSGWLARVYDENGQTGELLGLCLVERSERWAAMIPRPPEGGTTNPL